MHNCRLPLRLGAKVLSRRNLRACTRARHQQPACPCFLPPALPPSRPPAHPPACLPAGGGQERLCRAACQGAEGRAHGALPRRAGGQRSNLRGPLPVSAAAGGAAAGHGGGATWTRGVGGAGRAAGGWGVCVCVCWGGLPAPVADAGRVLRAAGGRGAGVLVLEWSVLHHPPRDDGWW